MTRSSLLLSALLGIAGCDGVSTGAGDVDGGIPCLQPTVVPQLVAGDGMVTRARLEVDLGEVATGLDPVVLSSVHLRVGSGEPLGMLEGAQLSGGLEGRLLAASGPAEAGLLSLPTESEVDLRGLASNGRLALQLELRGKFLTPLALELCVTKVTPRGRL